MNEVCKDPRERPTGSVSPQGGCLLPVTSSLLPSIHHSILPSWWRSRGKAMQTGHLRWSAAALSLFLFLAPLLQSPFISGTSRVPFIGLSPRLLPSLSSPGLFLVPERPSEPGG